MLKKLISLVVSLGIICSLVVLPAGTAYASDYYGCGEYNAEDGCVYISNAQQLVTLSQISNTTTGHPVMTAYFKLSNDITIPPTYANQINIATDSDNPFSGTFDGNGYTISGLTYNDQTDTDTGLFKYTKAAEIKNLTINYANIKAVNRCGILVGRADDTKFLNISISNSTLNIMSGGAVIELITADGVTCGGMVGEAVNCYIYNCETVDTSLETPESEGITALGGSGYYMGGLVGTLDTSHIEYSRTLSEQTTNSGQVKLAFILPVSAAGAKKTYVGGITGEMKNGSTITDCFSNVSLISEPGVALAIGYFTYGFAGGIAGAMYGDQCTILRTHYSGRAEQQDSGGILIIGYTYNKHIGGIVGYIDSTDNIDSKVQYSFYNDSRIKEADHNPKSAVVWSSPSASLYDSHTPQNCKSYTDEQYADKAHSWESNFDFNGNILRDTNCNVLFKDNGNNGQHVNQWIMYTYNYSNTGDTAYSTTTMPIHGTTTMEIYSNYHNAFTDENADSMTYEYTINDDQTVNVPDSNSVSALVAKENTAYAGYIGLAFVSRNTTQQGTSYNCDYIYAAKKVNENDETITNTVPLNIIQIYSSDPDKRIYAVWCQGKTIGGQLNLSGSSGIRVLTAVNTKLLENIALDKPDDEYGRAVTFKEDATTEYLIKAISKTWHGEQYVEAAGASAAKDEIPNAQVFSIYLSLDENQYSSQINAVGDILLNDSSAEGKLIDYMCGGSFKSSAKQIAEAYFNDLMAGDYQISDDAYINLINYIPEIANEEIDMSSDMDFDQFDDAMPEAEAQAE